VRCGVKAYTQTSYCALSEEAGWQAGSRSPAKAIGERMVYESSASNLRVSVVAQVIRFEAHPDCQLSGANDAYGGFYNKVWQPAVAPIKTCCDGLLTATGTITYPALMANVRICILTMFQPENYADPTGTLAG
jgi:hypothetical protein